MNCVKCGATNLPEMSAFCTYCGASTTPAVAPGVAPNLVSAPTSSMHDFLAKAQGQGLRVDDRLVWVLAFMPLLGDIFEGLVAGVIYGNSFQATLAVRNGHFWWVTLAVNIALCWRDEKNLRAAGVDTSAFGKMLWLIPVYLYQRSKALGHTPAYFITWCVCFAFLIF